MIFFTNNFERYTYALRNTIQLSVIKKGIQKRHLDSLMKIHKAEAIFSKETAPIDINKYSNVLLRCAFIKRLEKEEKLSFCINISGVFLINKKLYTSLLLTLCKTASNLKITLQREKLVITAKNINIQKVLPIARTLNANMFFENKSKTALFVITVPRTDKKAAKIQEDWEYLLNPLSVINIYLS